ncbi:MAG: hypothetical protein IJU92_09370 [Spirochaetaceae bacterium]|nr:hypothetical protein [Spirochaetaceae bacterium]
MDETIMQMYEMMNETAQKELYDFALFLVSKQNSIQPQEINSLEKFFELGTIFHGNSNGQKWTRDELYER